MSGQAACSNSPAQQADAGCVLRRILLPPQQRYFDVVYSETNDHHAWLTPAYAPVSLRGRSGAPT